MGKIPKLTRFLSKTDRNIEVNVENAVRQPPYIDIDYLQTVIAHLAEFPVSVRTQ